MPLLPPCPLLPPIRLRPPAAEFAPEPRTWPTSTSLPPQPANIPMLALSVAIHSLDRDLGVTATARSLACGKENPESCARSLRPAPTQPCDGRARRAR